MEEIRRKIRKILLEYYLKEGTDNVKRYKLNIFVPENVKKIKDSLKKFGYECYMIGGCVRDAILNKTPKDYDLVTDAPPDNTIQILRNEHYVKHILETGKKFGIVNVITKDGEEYEIAVFREDISAGRHPDVKLNASMEGDAKRRDLTINALFYDIDNHEVIDYVGGFEDLKNREINTVGDPNERFQEDALRLIRIIRFFCRLNSAKFNNETIAAIKDNLYLLSEISAERIRDEFLKGLSGSKSIIKYLELLNDFGFFKYIFGSLNINPNYFIEERNPIILLSNLLKDNNIKEIQKELASKRYTINEINCIIFLISLFGLNENSASTLKKFYLQNIKAAYPDIEDVMDKFAGLNHIDKTKIKNFLRLANEFVQPSELLQSMGYKDKDLGVAIARLEKEFYNNPDRAKRVLDSGDTEEIKKLIFIGKD